MCELQWDALAEIYLSNKDCPDEIYCLCSRVFIRNRDEKLKLAINTCDDLSASDADVCNEDDASTVPDGIEFCQYEDSTEAKQDIDVEVVSCYCSASHTDNISTDEHDSLRDSHIHTNKSVLLRGLQSSDSGADLTEYVKTDDDLAWHQYWAINGETLIWDSWIAKYSAYINPVYLQTNTEHVEVSSSTSHILESSHDVGVSKNSEHSTPNNFSFDNKDLEKFSNELLLKQEGECNSVSLDRIDENLELKNCVERRKSQEIAQSNCMLIRALSGSDSFDKLHTEISEGWNPLSPASIDYEIEAERLLSSRCGSHASSSVRTVDSMTNVTRMTVSSFDFSDSSKTSDSISSVSSVQSSFSSTSSEEIEDSTDYEQQWNSLWKKHYEEEYLEQYKKFLNFNNFEKININKETGTSVDSLHEVQHPLICDKLDSFTPPIVKNIKKPLKLNNRENNCKRKSKRSLMAVGYLLNSLKMNDSSNTVSMDESEIDTNDFNAAIENLVQTSIGDDKHNQDIKEEMKGMGLPVSFGKKSTESRSKFDSTCSKQSYDSNLYTSDQCTSNRIKSAFSLMGIEFNEVNQSRMKGQVDYKMKHIRLQNRHLKLHQKVQKKIIRPKHIYFDDDGNAIPTDKDSEEVVLQNISDNSDVKQSTSSNDDDLEISKASLSPQDIVDAGEKNGEPIQSRKKKRKRKINFPAEIKENPKLKKYWNRRFSLFNKFDMGIKLDEESWYSATPEQVAKHTAERLKCDIIIDAFCGAGGNSIQFALTCKKVIAIDIDSKKIELARNNAEVYGVADRIDFIIGDFFKLSEKLQADVVFLSPPWGGPSYVNQPTYELEEFLQPVPLSNLLQAARGVSKNVALFLPRNSNTYSLVVAAGPGGNVEIEQNFINKKLIAITAYYNDLIKNL